MLWTIKKTPTYVSVYALSLAYDPNVKFRSNTTRRQLTPSLSRSSRWIVNTFIRALEGGYPHTADVSRPGAEADGQQDAEGDG